ncbi:unnamed protein product [Danaus chrysippus]|uniref:(African queen) hypothetical protein n=1 Tax=Danaus chrysippus TaxID=151541 RepID=A0A8J2QND5_9NEOP|nr:unnamed protein product [Danaus chrysippus]
MCSRCMYPLYTDPCPCSPQACHAGPTLLAGRRAAGASAPLRPPTRPRYAHGKPFDSARGTSSNLPINLRASRYSSKSIILHQNVPTSKPSLNSKQYRVIMRVSKPLLTFHTMCVEALIVAKQEIDRTASVFLMHQSNLFVKGPVWGGGGRRRREPRASSTAASPPCAYGRRIGRDGGVEAVALARDAIDIKEGRISEGRGGVLSFCAGDGRQEGRQDAYRAVRGIIRGWREQTATVRALVRARCSRQAVPLRGRTPVQPVAMCSEVLVLVRAGPLLLPHRGPSTQARGTLLGAGVGRLVHGLCDRASWLRVSAVTETKDPSEETRATQAEEEGETRPGRRRLTTRGRHGHTDRTVKWREVLVSLSCAVKRLDL